MKKMITGLLGAALLIAATPAEATVRPVAMPQAATAALQPDAAAHTERAAYHRRYARHHRNSRYSHHARGRY